MCVRIGTDRMTLVTLFVQYDKGNEADRMLLMKVLLHAADIGNAVSEARMERGGSEGIPFHE